MLAKIVFRQLLHGCLLLGGWSSFALFWLLALADHAQCRLLAGWLLARWCLIALAITIWVAHLLSIALQKSPRLQHPVAVALYVRDRLGRPVHAPWPDLRQLQCIAIKFDASGKHYQAGIGPLPGPPAGLPCARRPDAGEIALIAAWSGGFQQLVCGFIVLYPMFASMFWMTAAIFFLARWERPARRLARRRPFVSVVIYARQHGASLDQVLAATCHLEYRGYEVIVLDDAADAQTISCVAPFVQSGQVRLISKVVAEGRAMAFNDVLPCVNGEVVLLLDGDVTLAPGVLKEMLPHFEAPRAAAVTGNVRIWQPRTLLGRFQSLECSAIFSLVGRGQRVIGRGYVLPGSLIACRKAALQEIGYFDPQVISTEMDATWRLQKRSWDLRFEPRAVAWRPAAAARTLLLQHLDAAVALVQMLGRHTDILRDRRYRRMWPLFAGACLSFLWAITSWGMAVYGTAQVMGAGRLLPGVYLPGPWVMAMVTLLMGQAGMGLWADRRYDPCQRGNGFHLILYPLLYWLFVAGTLAAALPVCGLLHLLNRSSSPPGSH